jgi:hypothetical protein
MWQNSVDHLLAFLAGWEAMGDNRVLDQAQELYHAIFTETFYEWRYGRGKQAGNNLSFKSNQSAFWEEWAKNERSGPITVDLNSQNTRLRLRDEYMAIRREIAGLAHLPEGAHTREFLSRVVRFQNGDHTRQQAELEADSAVLVTGITSILSTGMLPLTIDAELATRHGLDLTAGPGELLPELRRAKNDVESCLGWIRLEFEFRQLAERGEFSEPDVLKGILTRKAKLYSRERRDQLAHGLEGLREHVSHFDRSRSEKVLVSVEETDHPAILTRMGCLSPRLMNCYNPNADPAFTQWVIGACGTPAFKIVVTTDLRTREILSPAPLKIRTGVSASRHSVTNFFLERGPFAGSYDFRKESLDLVSRKAQRMYEKFGEQIPTCHQVLGRKRRTDVILEGIGAFTDTEYAEAVFGLRNANRISHIGRVYDPLVFVQQRDEPQILGLGIGNKALDRYLRELRDRGASAVFDLRADPGPRRAKAREGGEDPFARESLSKALGEAGIEYYWLGEQLSNGATSSQRAVSAYRQFMDTARYQGGREFVMAKLRTAAGPVVLTTNELKDSKCFRRLVIEDIVSRLGEGLIE